MARARKSRKRFWLALVLASVLVLGAVAAASVWGMYRAYPYDYRAAIEGNADLYGQDPLFIAAIVRTESGCKPDAVSGAGAVGLMQIMPETGEWIAKKNNWEFAPEKLRDGEYNIQLGCWYVDYLSDRFGQDWTLTLAAYNAGENTVRKWAGEGRFAPGKYDIPYRETSSFVRKVLNAYEWYQRLYKGR